MHEFDSKDLKRLFGIPASHIRALIRAGHINPSKRAGKLSYSFQDLIVLRTARALIDAKIPAKRIHRSLENLRRELPDSMPLSGISISAVGDAVVVRDGEAHRHIDSGQYLLGLDVSFENGVLHVVEHRQENSSE